MGGTWSSRDRPIDPSLVATASGSQLIGVGVVERFQESSCHPTATHGHPLERRHCQEPLDTGGPARRAGVSVAPPNLQKTTLGSPNPPFEDVVPEDLVADDLPDSSGSKWYRLHDVVVVFADLKNSTQLSVGKHPSTTAAIYQVATGNVVRILHDLEADFIQTQGDGVFGLFWGEKRLERAICAGITVKTFSREVLQKQLETKWPKAPRLVTR